MESNVPPLTKLTELSVSKLKQLSRATSNFLVTPSQRNSSLRFSIAIQTAAFFKNICKTGASLSFFGSFPPLDVPSPVRFGIFPALGVWVTFLSWVFFLSCVFHPVRAFAAFFVFCQLSSLGVLSCLVIVGTPI